MSRTARYIDSQIDVNGLLPIDVLRAGVGFSAVPKRRDRLAEALRQEIVTLMKHHGEMKQIELARRAGEDQQRVHKFVKGQMPYPPLEFLDTLFKVFGVTLVDGLRGHVPPVTQLPIRRPDVQAVADDCAGMDVEGVKAVQYFVSTLRGASRRAPRPDTIAPARRGRTGDTSRRRATQDD